MLHATDFAAVLTTVVTFLLFVWILRAFAWGPVSRLLEERRERIAEDFKEAGRLKEEAQRLEDEYAKRLQDIDQEARRRINDAVAEGQRIRDEIVAKAQDEARKQSEKQKQALDLEVAKARIQIKDNVIGMVLSTTERLLHEQLDDPKHRELVDRFVTDLEARDRAG